jgi:hypothetical protein
MERNQHDCWIYALPECYDLADTPYASRGVYNSFAGSLGLSPWLQPTPNSTGFSLSSKTVVHSCRVLQLQMDVRKQNGILFSMIFLKYIFSHHKKQWLMVFMKETKCIITKH